MKTSIKISLFSLGAALIGFWPAGANAQGDRLVRCGLVSPRSLLGLAPGGAAAHAAMIKRTLKCLQGASGQASDAASPAAGGQFVTFDPPGSTGTTPSGITNDGTIIGSYADASGVQHGFLRTPTGSFTTSDPPGSTLTLLDSIALSGDIAGVYCDTAYCASHGGFAQNYGFVRTKQGTFTTFDAPGGGSLFPALYSNNGPPPSINPAGAIAGTYFDTSGNEHGFLRDKSGAVTTIDAPSAFQTEVLAINPSGAVAGDYSTPTAVYVGFIRTGNGSFTTINPPGSVACGGYSGASAINPAGVVAGSTYDPTCSVPLGYLRTPDGAITTFSVPGAKYYISPETINPAGAITGHFCCGSSNAFLRTPDGAITVFAAPGASLTFPSAINATEAIIGVYLDANGVLHGFLRLP
jgi:hypothetical protein